MIFTGIGDEAGSSLTSQITATRELGWKYIEARNVEITGYPKANLHDIPEPAFDIAVQQLREAQIEILCFGSTIMNWAKTIETPFDVTLQEVERAIPRMKTLGTKFVRVMSFKPGEQDNSIPAEVIKRVKEVTQRFLDNGLQPVHENCMNYGGMSPQHALELIEKVPGLKWVFDTANPVFNGNRSLPQPWPKQDPWEFWTAVRDHTIHIHIKDARWNDAKNDADYTFPGEGDGRVRDILKDAIQRGYSGAISIEPHMVSVFHDPAGGKSVDEADQRANYVEYGRRLEKLVTNITG